jgi:RNA polymerase sigma factor (sigma-70 family)
MHHITNDPDQELVELAQNGDTRAFDSLIEKHHSRLYGLVHHMTSHHEDSHDILQEVYSRAFRSIRSFRGHSSFHTWIHQIAVNHTLNFLLNRHINSLKQLDAHLLKRLLLWVFGKHSGDLGTLRLALLLNQILAFAAEDLFLFLLHLRFTFDKRLFHGFIDEGNFEISLSLYFKKSIFKFGSLIETFCIVFHLVESQVDFLNLDHLVQCDLLVHCGH